MADDTSKFLDLPGFTYFADKIKAALAKKANASHTHGAGDISSGTLSSDCLPTVPVEKGGTGATTAADALTNLGLTATAEELNYTDGVTSNIQTQLDAKAGTDLGNVEAADFMAKSQESGGLPIVTTEGDGAAYTATVDGLTALAAGVTFIMIPHVVSTSKLPTLDVNGLGAKTIRRRVSNSTVTTTASVTENWLGANKPIQMFYDGTYWIADFPRPNATDIYGTLPITSGGTGATTAEAALTNLGAAPAYTYGTDDMTAGTSELETGKLYFVYE